MKLNTVKPITPEEAATHVIESLPNEIISSFNNLIMQNYSYNGGSATVTRSEVVTEICEQMSIKNADQIDIRWLDIEPVYERSGWTVEYITPDIGDKFAAYFLFTKAR